ncbi:MAG: hypothetical protein CFK52_11785 [Chloracidobacterium sp. CP2_5A]|nr:MAG: hypothetical protein CFK52_11785 [Chloracidobacterium sp. CP2_5A]
MKSLAVLSRRSHAEPARPASRRLSFQFQLFKMRRKTPNGTDQAFKPSGGLQAKADHNQVRDPEARTERPRKRPPAGVEKPARPTSATIRRHCANASAARLALKSPKNKDREKAAARRRARNAGPPRLRRKGWR